MTSGAGDDLDAEAGEADDPETKAEATDPVALIARRVTELSTGDRAGLRRIYLTRRHEADGVVIGLLHHAGVPIPQRADIFAPWRLLAHAAALLSGTAQHQPHSRHPVGTALYAAGYSENSLLRPTAARGVALQGQIIRAVRRLAQGGQAPVNLWTLFDLAGRHPTRIEEARLRIAQDFYAADARSKGIAK